MFIFDKSNIGTILSSSIRYRLYSDLWGIAYETFTLQDMDIDDGAGILVAVIGSGLYLKTPSNQREQTFGRSGDSHDTRLEKYSLTSLPGTLLAQDYLAHSYGFIEPCDSVNISGSYIYLSCGMMDPQLTNNSSPFLAIFRVSDMVKERQINMGFKFQMTYDQYSYHLIPQSA